MTENPLSRYAHLWDGTEEGWVVVKVGDGHSIYNERTRAALAIDDDELHDRVVEMMLEAGAPLRDTVIGGPVSVDSPSPRRRQR